MPQYDPDIAAPKWQPLLQLGPWSRTLALRQIGSFLMALLLDTNTQHHCALIIPPYTNLHILHRAIVPVFIPWLQQVQAELKLV